MGAHADRRRGTALLFETGSSRACAALLASVLGVGAFGCETLDTRRARRVSGVTTAVEVALGWAHSCARTEDGEVRCWGSNRYGQLGAGLRGGRTYPPQPPRPFVRGEGDSPFGLVSVQASALQTCARDGSGQTWCAGADPANLLAYGTPDVACSEEAPLLACSTAARPIAPPAAAAVPSAIAYAGDLRYGTLCVQAERAVECRFFERTVPTGVPFVRVLTVSGEEFGGVEEVVVGATHACVRSGDGRVRCAGALRSVQAAASVDLGESAGRGVLVDFGIAAFAFLPELFNARSLSTSDEHLCAVMLDTTVRCMGRADRFELGTDDAPPLPGTAPLPDGGGVGLDDAGAGLPSTDAGAPVLEAGGGDAGTQPIRVQVVPREVPGLRDVEQVAAGLGFTCVRRRDETVRCFGDNRFGQLGSPDVGEQSREPVLVENLPRPVLTIAAGGRHACAIAGVSRDVFCWGANDVRQTAP